VFFAVFNPELLVMALLFFSVMAVAKRAPQVEHAAQSRH
jgi:hypothetical protein